MPSGEVFTGPHEDSANGTVRFTVRSAPAGIEVDGARFRPHLTVGRTKHPHDVSNWVRLLDSYRSPTWTVDHLTLVASYLGEGPRGRPRYETVGEFRFGG